jgi:hypothetical protein
LLCLLFCAQCTVPTRATTQPLLSIHVAPVTPTHTWQDSGANPRQLLILPILKIANKTKNDVWFIELLHNMLHYLEILRCFFFASKLMLASSSSWRCLSWHRGFKFHSCAIVFPNRSKTSQDAWKDDYHAFPLQHRQCYVVAENVR